MSEMVERVMKALQLYGTDIDRQMARAAIAAMREPTDRMVNAGATAILAECEQFDETSDHDSLDTRHLATRAWHDAIDEALR